MITLARGAKGDLTRLQVSPPVLAQGKTRESWAGLVTTSAMSLPASSKRLAYSSPTLIPPGVPRVFWKVANSLGAARSGSAARAAITSPGVADDSRIRAR